MNEYVKALQQGVEKELPSGMVVRLRPVDSSILLGQNLPQPLMRIVEKYLGIVQSSASAQQSREQLETSAVEIVQANGAVQTMMDMRSFGAIVAKASFVWPRISDDPKGDDEISTDWMETNDLIAVTKIIGLPLVQLIPFRFIEDEVVEPVQSGESDVSVAEPGAEPERVGAEPDGDRQRLDNQLSV